MIKLVFKLFIVLVMTCNLSGCVDQFFVDKPSPSQSTITYQSEQYEDDDSDDDNVDVVAIPLATATTIEPRKPIVQLGNGRFVSSGKTASNNVTSQENGDISLNFQGVDLHAFLKVVFADVLALNYTVADSVKGKVTIQTSKPVSKDELIPLTESILAMNDAALIVEKNLYQIVPKSQAAKRYSSPNLKSAKNGYSVQVVPLKFIAAQEMKKILEPFISETNTVQVDNQRNILILSGSAPELANVQEMIALFDIDWMKGMSVGLFPLKNSKVDVIKSELETILSTFDQNSEEPQAMGGLVKIIAIERLNSILAVSPSAKALKDVQTWLKRLDQESDQATQKFYVYKVQNSKAVELANVLNLIFNSGDAGNLADQGINERSDTMMGAKATEIATGEKAKLLATNRQNRTARNNSNVYGLTAGKAINIIADDIRNSLIIRATQADYAVVLEVIDQLDTVPLQVLIEASIIEVTLTDNLNFGVEWFFKGNFDGKQGIGTLDLGSAGISAQSPAFSFTVVDNLNNIRVALNALAVESELNVLSSPSIMVLDNQTAKINVGDEIPIPTRQSVSNIDPTAPTVNEIEFRKTGVTLTVTPRVNDSGLVTMEIKQEVSNAVQTTTSSLDAPTIQQREIESVVAINSGETIVLGGLIQDSQVNNESGIPGLHNLPFIGSLFGQITDEKHRTELLVLITPRVIRNKKGAHEITDEFRKKLQSIYFMQSLGMNEPVKDL